MLTKAFPEAFDKEYPRDGPLLLGLVPSAVAMHDEMCKVLDGAGGQICKTWSDADWESLWAARGQEMWSHEGVCSCGRKTYLFGQCARCLREKAAERHAEVLEETSKGEDSLVLAGWLPEKAPEESGKQELGKETSNLIFLTPPDVERALASTASKGKWSDRLPG